MTMNRSRRVLLGLALLAFVFLPLLKGQDRVAISPLPRPATVGNDPAGGKQHDPARMTPLQRHLYLSAQRAADWLRRANKPDGRFVYGFLPAVRLPMEEDSYLRQAEAAGVLARSAKFFHNEQADAIARQALLTLLLDTVTSEQWPVASGQNSGQSPVASRQKEQRTLAPLTTEHSSLVRHTIPAGALVNRPAAAGLLVRAVHELPSPGQDLLDQADQLCNFLKTQVQADGSILLAANANDVTPEMVEYFSGPALLGIVRSQTLRPAAWKLDALRRARGYYEARWRQHKSYPMVADHSAAFAEAFALTKDKAFAEPVFAMNDWLCTLQYKNLDGRRSSWNGGFPPWMDGKATTLAPDVHSAAAAESLAEACRAAQLAGDPARHRRYKEALENCLRFLTTMQYSEANTQHFAEWYRPLLVGGFYAAPHDGNLRLDCTVHSLNGLVAYLDYVAELP